MTPLTTLAPNAPWPTPAELLAIIAAAHQHEEDRLALQLKAKKRSYQTRQCQKVKP